MKNVRSKKFTNLPRIPKAYEVSCLLRVRVAIRMHNATHRGNGEILTHARGKIRNFLARDRSVSRGEFNFVVCADIHNRPGSL